MVAVSDTMNRNALNCFETRRRSNEFFRVLTYGPIYPHQDEPSQSTRPFYTSLADLTMDDCACCSGLLCTFRRATVDIQADSMSRRHATSSCRPSCRPRSWRRTWWCRCTNVPVRTTFHFLLILTRRTDLRF